MAFMDWIIERLGDVSGFFYDIYREVLDWVYPFWLAADFFYNLHLLFNGLAWDFYDFANWVDDVVDELRDILSWSNIRSLIRGWLPDLEDVVDWWDRWWVWVGHEIDDWWDSTKNTVQGWIHYAEVRISDWIDSLERALTTLQAAWNDFKDRIPALDELWLWFTAWWANVLENLIDWGALTGTQIDSLIDSWFKSYEPFWAGWQDVRDNVIEFLTDPLTWLQDRFTDWFLGPEE